MDLLTFPRYNQSDVVTHVRNLILTGSEAKNFSKNDLFPNPKPELLHMIFTRTLQNVYGIRLEHFYMMPVNIELAYPEILEGFLPVCNLFIHMERFLPVCRVNDFQVADILNPKAKRISRFLSGILNFIQFRESRSEAYLEFQWTYKSAMEKIQQLQTANKDAAVKLEKLDTIPVEQQAEFKQLSDDIQELQQVLTQEYRRKTTALQEVISQRKAEVAERTRSLNELKVRICTLKEEQEQLKSKIVESPEELKNYKERMKETVQKLKKAKQKAIEKYESYQDLVENLPSCQSEVQLYQKRIQRHGENVERMSCILSEVRNLEDQIENVQRELKNAKTDEMALRRLVTAKLKKKHEDVEQHKHMVFEYCNRVQEKRGAVYAKMTAIHEEIQQVKSRIQQLYDSKEKEQAKAEEIYLSMRTGLEKYHEALAKIVDSHTPATAFVYTLFLWSSSS
uniref:Kinetochore protein NUF2 n=1 Tax=Sphenodon punctatus TaxID=8508 RepID=A0A8D0HHS0_SPHPU